VTWIEQFKRGDASCKHSWGDEQGERHLDHFMWWRACPKCGEKRPTRTLDRGPNIEVFDLVNGVFYVIGSKQNLAATEFRYIKCGCGNSLRVDFDLGDQGRVVRNSAVICEWCGATFSIGSRGPDHRPRSAMWADAPEVV
jgi:hypothetical protein